MSGVTAAGVLAAAVVAGTAYSIYSGEENARKQKSAQEQAKKSAEKQASDADQAFNAANRKKPDTGAALALAQQSSLTGQAGTMLTGPAGVGNLQLGRNTLLGG